MNFIIHISNNIKILLLCALFLNISGFSSAKTKRWSDGKRTYRIENYVYGLDILGKNYAVIPIPVDTINGICPRNSVKSETLCSDCGKTITWSLFGKGIIRLDALQMSSPGSMKVDTTKFEMIKLNNSRNSAIIRHKSTVSIQPLNRIDSLNKTTDISVWNVYPEYIKLAEYILQNSRIVSNENIDKYRDR